MDYLQGKRTRKNPFGCTISSYGLTKKPSPIRERGYSFNKLFEVYAPPKNLLGVHHFLFLINKKTSSHTGKRFFCIGRKWWAGKDSNLGSTDATDLQSVPFSHLDTYPRKTKPTRGIEPPTSGLQNRCSTN